jgi:hypothetical protein
VTEAASDAVPGWPPSGDEAEAFGRADYRAGFPCKAPEYPREDRRARWRIGWKKEQAASGEVSTAVASNDAYYLSLAVKLLSDVLAHPHNANDPNWRRAAETAMLALDVWHQRNPAPVGARKGEGSV